VVEFILVRVVAAGLFTRPGELPGLLWTALGSMLLLAPFSLLLGVFFPLAARSVARRVAPSGRQKGNAASIVYAAEAAGSLAGGLAFTFVLAGRVSHTALVLALGAALLAVAGAVAWRLGGSFGGRARIAFAASTGSAALAMLLVAVLASGPIERATARRGGRVHESYRVVASRDTPHQHLLLVEREGQYVLFAGGEPALTYEPADPGPRIAAHRALAWAESVERCLIIGFDPAAVRACLEQGAERVDVVEQDAGIVELIRPVLTEEDRARLEDERVHVHAVDARKFLVGRHGLYDFVMLNYSDPTSALVNRYFTAEFYRDVKSSLVTTGVFTFTADAKENVFDDDTTRYLSRLGGNLRPSGFEMIAIHDGGRARFVAWAGARPYPGSEPLSMRETLRLAETLRQRVEKRFPAVAPYFARANLAPERWADVDDASRKSAEESGDTIDLDLRPRAFLDYLRIWDRLSGSGVRWWLDFVGGLRLFYVVAFSVACMPWLALFAVRGEKATWPAVVAGGTAGFSAMVLTVALLLAYQCLHGTVYQAVGALSAAFMAGFAGGSFGARRLAGWGGRPWRAVLAADVAGVLVILLALGLVPVGAMRWPVLGSALFALLLLLTGAVAGLELPLLARVLSADVGDGSTPGNVARAAGTVDAADHAGAFLGALLAGTLLVPAFGIPGALVALAALRCASLAALGASALRKG
jgi:spermidine synthase